MTESPEDRTAARRALVEREILDAAWRLAAAEGVGALRVREVARSVGMRPQSVAYYFPSKRDLVDALFADAFAELHRTLDRQPVPADEVDAVVGAAVLFVDYWVRNPARYHLMLQRPIPGFEPGVEAHRVALDLLRELVERLAAAGVTADADVALVRSMMSGLAAEQIANDPEGHLFVDQAARAVGVIVASLRAPS